MRALHWPAASLMVVVIISGLAFAGYTSRQIRTQVDLVVVPVGVRDSEGRLVTGLQAEDFSVLEDGKTQRISNFSLDPIPLSAVILIDDGMSRTMLRRLYPYPPVLPSPLITFTSGFSEFDEAASFRYDHSIYRLADFANNPFAIEESFREIAQIAETRPDDPADMLAEKGPGWLRSILNVLGGGGDGGRPSATPGMPPPSPRANPRPSNRLMHDAIHDAALALQSRPANRRRIIVVISDGKDIGSTHTLAENTDLLLNQEIQFYAVSMSFATFGSFGLLSDYARATGGDAYPGTSTTSLETAFNQITEQARNQYILGYVSNNTAGESAVFRKIEVRMRSPKHKATYRKGYMQYPKR